jgi:predicted DsbA family dithiol-disulfide isomerase
MKTVELDVVSDIMCPWCYIGRKRLEKALNMLEGIKVNVHWRPYQLDATLPAEGKDRQQYLDDKFGGPGQAGEMYKRVEEAGRDEGIDFAFDAIKIAPNTFNAHRLIRWAANGGDGVQQKMVDRLFQLFFEEGANLADQGVLIDAAVEVGMDRALLDKLLPGDSDIREVREEISVAQKMGVTGVPCFIINNKFAVMGAQEPETIAQAIRDAAEETKEETPE